MSEEQEGTEMGDYAESFLEPSATAPWKVSRPLRLPTAASGAVGVRFSPLRLDAARLGTNISSPDGRVRGVPHSPPACLATAKSTRNRQ